MDPFKLKARTLSADVKRRLAPLSEMIRREGGKGVKVSVSRNLFESEEVTEVKFVITVVGLPGEGCQQLPQNLTKSNDLSRK